MNVQLHHVISDLTGLTGLTIIEAILAGERKAEVVGKLRDWRNKGSEQTIAKSVIGDYRREHLFTLRQSLESFRHYQKLISACDTEIEQYLEAFESKDSKLNSPAGSTPASPEEQKPQGSEPGFDLKSHLHRIFGVDLTTIPGISVLTAQTIFTEIGPDFSKFDCGGAFTSWLRVCPDNRVSGGKVLSAKTHKVSDRATTALHTSARSLHHSQSYLGDFYRRMRAKLGAPKAITATTHKLARIIYYLIRTGKAYDETICATNEAHNPRLPTA